MSSFGITKREVLFSIIIVLVMITVGFFVGNAITDAVSESNETYYKSVKIDNSNDQFVYGMKTNIGNALVYGDFKSVDPVSMSELANQYWYIEKVTERYTMHTRTVTSTDSNGKTTTRTETYYTWDTVDTDIEKSSITNFLGEDFESSKFAVGFAQSLPLNDGTVSESYRSWISWRYLYQDGDKWENVGDLRYRYNVVPTKFSGTIMAKLKDGTIYNYESDKKSVGIYHEQKIADVIKSKENSESTASIIFWVVWSILIGVAVFGFLYIDNKWLEN